MLLNHIKSISHKAFALFILLGFYSLCGFSQGEQKIDKRFNAGLKLGMNTSQMTGDGYSGFYKFGLVAGAFVNYKINPKWNLQYEIIYSGKGSKKPSFPDKGIHDYYKVHLDYLEIPVLFQYQLNRFEIEFGPGFGILLNSKEWDEQGERDPSLSPFSWRTLEVDAMLGVNYYMKPDKFFINARAHHSILSVVHSTVTTRYGVYGGAWNIVLALSMNYQF